MVGDQQIQAHRYTVGALLLQAVILIGSAVLSYLGSLSTTDPFIFAGNSTLAVYFGVLGAIAIWLTGEHYTDHVRSSRLKLWAAICIVLSLIPIALYVVIFFDSYAVMALVGLIQPLLFLIPSILVFLFSMKEIPSN